MTIDRVPDGYFDGGANITGRARTKLSGILEDIMGDMALLGSTSEDVNLYVSTQGDDTYGNGTYNLPYKTPTRALQDVPFIIQHNVHIRILAGNYTSFPAAMNNIIRANGQLILEGIGTAPVLYGPFAITTFTLQTGRYELVVTGAGWTPDDFHGKFVRITSGPGAGYVFAVFKNTADTITIPRPLGTVPVIVAGNTFEIVDTPVKIEVDHPIYIECLNKSAAPATSDLESITVNAASRIGLAALTLKTTSLEFEAIEIIGTAMVFNFVCFNVPYVPSSYFNGPSFVFKEGSINEFPMINQLAFDDTRMNYATGVTSFTVTYGTTAPGATEMPWSFRVYGPLLYLRGVSYRGSILAIGIVSGISYATVGRLHLGPRSQMTAISVYVDSTNHTTANPSQSQAVNVPGGTRASLNTVYIKKCMLNHAIEVAWDAFLQATGNIQGDSAGIPQYGVFVRRGGILQYQTGNTLNGTLGNCYSEGLAAAVLWSATPVPDTFGGWIVRIN